MYQLSLSLTYAQIKFSLSNEGSGWIPKQYLPNSIKFWRKDQLKSSFQETSINTSYGFVDHLKTILFLNLTISASLNYQDVAFSSFCCIAMTSVILIEAKPEFINKTGAMVVLRLFKLIY